MIQIPHDSWEERHYRFGLAGAEQADIIQGHLERQQGVLLDIGCGPQGRHVTNLANFCKRVIATGLVSHSDHVAQSASADTDRMLGRQPPVGSMTRKGDSRHNAVEECFFASLKTEPVDGMNCATRHEARRAVLRPFDGSYNRERLHSTLGYMSPVEFERQIATQTN